MEFIPSPEVGFKLTIKAVKELLVSYVCTFSGDLQKTFGFAAFRIPKEYIKNANLLKTFQLFPESFIKENSLYHIPDISEPLEIKRIPRDKIIEINQMRTKLLKNIENELPVMESSDEIVPNIEKWNIYIIASENPTKLEELNVFEEDKKNITQRIIGAYIAAKMILLQLLRENKEYANIDIFIDEANLCAKIIDKHFPNYSHPMKLTFVLKREN